MDIPINPKNKARLVQVEDEKLRNNQSKFIQKLLKQNFDKYRLEKPTEA
jgi:hypothetical protein